ncbi:MAG: UDP-3-O-(3-hydroxymyristoyl)glucosamine N-acyltransferase [Elusimicrobia bacterium]|nr:UDP-3-O-(3-hydroxymyristoyl)glucosamine N-acyltransferase [Elusimicrobiota bacterium]
MTLQELAAALGLEARGAPDYEIKGVRDIEMLSEDQGLEDNRVYFIESQAVLKRHPKAAERGAVLTTPAMADLFPRALIASEGKARLALIALLKKFDREPSFPAGVSPDAIVDPSAKVSASAAVLAGAVVMAGAAVGERCVLYPGVVLEPSAVVGDDTVLFPCVVVGRHCVLGKHCIVHGGTVIGSDGFGFYDEPGARHKVPQIGNVVIADHVELGSGCTIDRATIESTSIGEHTKLDNQVHIAHNCRIGRYVYIAGNTGLAGSVVVEDGVMISGMVSILDHVRLAKGTIIMGMSGVAKDTEPKTAYFGTPARPARQTHNMNAALERLPELLARVRHLEEKAASPAPAAS